MFLAEFTFMQIALVVLVIVLVFGSARLPETMRNLGKSVSEFKKGVREGEDEAKRNAEAKAADDTKKT
jgi:sec-independent protein translocase protein TatA